ncbi:mannose-6-phosphate isomerase [Micromonospora echinospora]|uniref:DNA-binding transcriptional regulator, MurR/RpiR family, contains HTH and SIS domains n=1 Tax=Micromonospora echinospora TaxID=1877 RepID=A0A1C4V5J4_MICEC|nr:MULTISPECIES: SIS domain-containing protein [Micromonospora]OZV83086.1 mannose-6-phosphate isomerase [Micromonospora echinospora]GLY21921.1 bifunctional glucose-6-phosphate/mannose-6-phosphate isomerase [Micromonospora sp. NBRC 101691]SCE79039.1 DNA-binding transcriptional regulator, MurR/RpiR family, contains HTH and SIS domains [Micromonospora echinospora]
MIEGTAGVSGHREANEALLDNPDALAEQDPGGMLRHIASAGAQVRETAALAAEANLQLLADEGRPRAVVIAGIGTAGRTGDVLATVAGPRCPVPVIPHRSAGVPGWVGAADVVIAVSASGRSPEALGAAEAAHRRGARLVAVGAPDSQLQSVAERARAPFIPVPRRAPARASLWALTVPVLLAARTLGLVKVNEADLAETAARLDADADRCRPTAESFVNPAKSLALGLAGSIPIVWGSSPLATVAARRFGDTLSANARYPVVAGALGEAGRGRVGLLDGVFGGLVESARDIFADPDDTPDGTRLRVVLLRDGGLNADDDSDEPLAVEERRADAVQTLAERRGVRCDVVTAEGGSALERLASLVAVPDFASIYLALAHGLDPMAVPAVSEMKELANP